ncbi:MAG: hypothetical protein GY716_12570 [bacterium]|nr:hypothetical protein [bacterium]
MKPLVAGSIVAAVVVTAAVVFFRGAQNAQSEAEIAQALSLGTQNIVEDAAPRVSFTSNACNTVHGDDAVAFCDGVPKPTSFWLTERADEVTLECLEYASKTLSRTIRKTPTEVACDIKDAYGHKDFEFDHDADRYGLHNRLSGILEEHYNQ